MPSAVPSPIRPRRASCSPCRETGSHASQTRPVAGARRLAALLLLGMAAVAAGCGGDGASGPGSLHPGCLDEGTCECRADQDCPFGERCVDGRCRSAGTAPDADAGGGQPDGVGDEEDFTTSCEGNADCASGLCVERADGTKVCSRTCLESCPEGWDCRGFPRPGGGLGFFCLPRTERLCKPCNGDPSCGAAGDLCLDLEGGLFCGSSCSDGSCPDGFVCEERTSVDGASGAQCVPEQDTCLCTPQRIGESLPCAVTNEHGSCSGERTCQEGGTTTACDAPTPAPESCDGVDDDCDGFTDEELAALQCTRTSEEGTCQGERVCAGEEGRVCNAPKPETESCNNLDDDCDGATDETFRDGEGRYVDTAHCGGCQQSCEGRFAHADEVTCAVDDEGEPVCRVTSCEAGYWPAQPQQCQPVVARLCEPCAEDADCGVPGDRCLELGGPGTQRFCGRDCAAGNVYGTECPTGYTCAEATGTSGESVPQCVPTSGSCGCLPGDEGKPRPCERSNAHGTCFGVSTCQPSEGFGDCDAPTPAAESCNDADDDCDGLVDEGLGGTSCEVANEHGTCSGEEVCRPEEGGVVCTAGEPAAEVCNGLDDDCDGKTDEPFAVNVTDDDGEVEALTYSKDPDHCGGCGLSCEAEPPATEVACDGSGPGVTCRIEACEEGYYPFQGQACLPVPNHGLCRPCEDDASCPGPNDACLDYPDGSFCGRDCSEGSIYGTPSQPCTGVEGEQGCCPDGYLCDGSQCRRESNSCACDEPGELRACEVSNEHGTCQGFQTCTPTGPDAGWSACDAPTPSPEVCNGVDDDCDGLFDGADDSVDTSGLSGYPTCSTGEGACTGLWQCAEKADGSFGWTCSARQPEDETCNELDDDCDGATDEDFRNEAGQLDGVANCGACGLDCRDVLDDLAEGPDGEVAEDAVACEVVDGSPSCVPQACEPGFHPLPLDGPATACLPLETASCRPCSEASSCGSGVGHVCVPLGDEPGDRCAQRCGADAPFVGCTGELGEQGCCPSGFVCDGSDQGPICRPVSGSCRCRPGNDGAARPCTVIGEASKTVCTGTETCEVDGDDASWSACQVSGLQEVCDGRDNDCDDAVDENFRNDEGVYDADAHCGSCAVDCTRAWSPATQHAVGTCVTGQAGGPSCELDRCTESRFGGGTPCHDDADCQGDPTGGTCRTPHQRCGRACDVDADCPGDGICRDGWCTIGCSGDGACADAFGEASRCHEGACSVPVQWVDRDGFDGNGCECPTASSTSGDAPDTWSGWPAPGTPAVDRNCDGVDGVVERSLFVRAGASGGDGSRQSPYGSIGAALAAFEPAEHDAVLVAEGTYEERVTVPEGVALHGGYRDDFAERDPVLFATVVRAPEPAFGEGTVEGGSLRVEGATERTVVAGFVIQGYDVSGGGASAGQPSIAVRVTGGAPGLRLVSNRIVGGRGAPGRPGQAGESGEAGEAGGPGLDTVECQDANCVEPGCNERSCNGHEQPGGEGGANPSCEAAAGCPGMAAEGEESPQQADAPPSGCSYDDGGNEARYDLGPNDLCKYDCVLAGTQNGPDGSDGAAGSDGGGGAGCSEAFGTLSADAWSAGEATAGEAGQPGSGGQGGSAGGPVRNEKPGSCTVGNRRGDLGGSGGGGGAGGCGGAGGGAAGSGGASFGVLVTGVADPETAPTIRGNRVEPGAGGAGGRGGSAGAGGAGGQGGKAGTAGWPAWCAGIGGSGGRGGDGGAGGGGGGGCGGPSIGIAGGSVPSEAWSSGNTFAGDAAASAAGAGGEGGGSPAPGANGSGGVDGGSADVHVY